MNCTRRLDTSEELLVARYGHGFKLLPPVENPLPHSEYMSLGTVLAHNTFNVFLMDTESKVQTINEAEAEACGFDSKESALNKNIYDICSAKTPADMVRQNDVVVMQSQKIRMCDEYFPINHERIAAFLAIKFPWYNIQNEIVGIFGLSIAIGQQSISDAFNLFSELGFISIGAHQSRPYSGFSYDNIHFTKREADILYYTMRGQTAKQVALALQLSHRTIEQHLDNMKHKLGVHSKAQLIEKMIGQF